MSDEKIKLLALFFSKIRTVDNVDILKPLDEMWASVYDEHRIKAGFTEAQLIAHEAVIKHVLNES